ncbi:hypothetical protein [Amycolatopsis thermoflava]
MRSSWENHADRAVEVVGWLTDGRGEAALGVGTGRVLAEREAPC